MSSPSMIKVYSLHKPETKKSKRPKRVLEGEFPTQGAATRWIKKRSWLDCVTVP